MSSREMLLQQLPANPLTLATMSSLSQAPGLQGGPGLCNFLRSTPGQVHTVDPPRPTPGTPSKKATHHSLSQADFSMLRHLLPPESKYLLL